MEEHIKVLLDVEPPDREVTPQEEMSLTRQFLQSDFYRYVWLPRYREEMELADLNAMRQKDPQTRVGWLDFKSALWNIENVWLKDWLTPERVREEVAEQSSSVGGFFG